MMTWMMINSEIPFEIPDGLELAQAPRTDEKVFDLVSAAADAFLGVKIIYNCPAVGWIEGEVVKRKVNRRMKIGSDIVYFFVFFSTPQVLNLTNYNKDGSPEAPHFN